MARYKLPSPLDLVLVAALLVAGSLLHVLHTRQPYSEPRKSVERLVKAAGRGDLADFGQASTATYYGDFVRHFGEEKLRAVREIYREIDALGRGKWGPYRDRAAQLAALDYQRLRGEVTRLGRDAFNRLSVDERMQLMEDRAKYDAFTFDAGVKGLAPDDRGRIADPGAFRLGQDYKTFVERNAWRVLPEEDRAALGSEAALSSRDTPEKAAFFERVGTPLLSEPKKKIVEGITRAELADESSFRFRYGEPLAKAFLGSVQMPGDVLSANCGFPEEQLGSLLRGSLATCVIALQARDEPKTFTLSLRKQDWRWLVDSVEPEFYQVDWVRRRGEVK